MKDSTFLFEKKKIKLLRNVENGVVITERLSWLRTINMIKGRYIEKELKFIDRDFFISFYLLMLY